MEIRRENYEAGLFSSYRPPIPVVSIGNLTLGGNAKTPMSIFLANRFSALGLTPAVLSRGYRRRMTSSAPVVVSTGSGPLIGPETAGDEPFLIASLTSAAVVCAARRAQAAACALRLGANVLILDDGFQHLALARDLDILMLRSRAPFGNGLVIPAGRLRENLNTHRRAGILVAVGDALSDDLKIIASDRPLFLASVSPLGFRELQSGQLKTLDFVSQMKLGAFCGLAEPSSFYATLAKIGAPPTDCLSLPDHASYGPKTLNKLQKFFRSQSLDYLVTSAKDAVKIKPSLNLPILVLETELSLDRPNDFFSSVIQQLGL
jgi:tetraacyldisaccharide 4'-kinase